ncbi:MAG: TA system VapC family ribonuclease toxin [Nostocoides sp.]
MILTDVTVLLNALRDTSEHHAESLEYLSRTLVGSTPVGVLDETLVAVVRIASNPRAGVGVDRDTALAFCEAVRSAPAATRPGIGESTWSRFTALVSELDLSGNDVPDGWLAAVAMDLDATLVTFDRGFRRFPGLRLELLDSA